MVPPVKLVCGSECMHHKCQNPAKKKDGFINIQPIDYFNQFDHIFNLILKKVLLQQVMCLVAQGETDASEPKFATI
jgi:hypothetical protein